MYLPSNDLAKIHGNLVAPLGAVRGTPGAVRGTLDWDGEKVRVSGEKTLRKQTNRKK